MCLRAHIWPNEGLRGLTPDSHRCGPCWRCYLHGPPKSARCRPDERVRHLKVGGARQAEALACPVCSEVPCDGRCHRRMALHEASKRLARGHVLCCQETGCRTIKNGSHATQPALPCTVQQECELISFALEQWPGRLDARPSAVLARLRKCTKILELLNSNTSLGRFS